jgi:predicted TIM-barrel fold metal-dependent hydrolase
LEDEVDRGLEKIDGVATEKMTIIDSHCHIWGRGFLPPSFFHRAAEGWAQKEPGRTENMIIPRLLDGVIDENGDDFVKNMDTAGVNAGFVMMVDAGTPLFGMEPATTIDRQVEYYATLQERHRGRLFAHVAVDHRRASCLSIVSRAVRELGFVGIGEITPSEFTAADDALRPLMRLAADLGIPVQIHTRSGIWTELDGANLTESNPAHPIHVARLAHALPSLKLVLCHAGYPHWWQAAAQAIADYPNCVLDVSNWNERLTEPHEIVARLAAWRSLLGIERILFASDQVSGPRFTGARSSLGKWVAFFRDLPAIAHAAGYRFTAEEASRILGCNAQVFYGLELEPFVHAAAEKSNRP